MAMTSAQRIQATFSFQEPDRVPYVLPAAMHPAREMGLTIKQYFARPENVIEGQLRLKKKFGNDLLCCYPFAAMEMEAWGGDVIYFEQGPPNAGAPIIQRPEDILKLQPPEVRENRVLQDNLAAIRGVKEIVGDATPIAGAVISPFSLPIMQMGFEGYLVLIAERPDLVERLLQVNSHYCRQWANAQLEAGASNIMYVDPALSPTIMSREISSQYGMPTARDIVPQIQGPIVVHLASGRGLPLVDSFTAAGFIGMSVSAEEDLAELKAKCRGQLTLVGNLNALEMTHWSAAEVELQVKRAIAKAGPGGGFVLSDNHGEIPYFVEEDTLLAVVDAVQRWGHYPLDWVASFGD